jgi:uncharacterized iron-regulated protein
MDLYRNKIEGAAQPPFRYSFYIGFALISFFLGCTMKTNKLIIKDTSQSFEEDTIISAQTGSSVTFEEFLQDISKHKIIYVGEKHANRVHHKIQLKIIQSVFQNHRNMAIGMEMFDHSYQDVLDLWSAGKLDKETFLRKVHWYANWRYDFSLYKDTLEFIKENRIKLVALNVPFHIPPKIRVGGVENLADDEKEYLPKEIDTSNAAHKKYIKGVFGQHHFKGRVVFDDFYMAQCVWDEIMAESIALNLKDDTMVVLVGNGHIRFKYGIPDRTFRRTGVSFRTIYLAEVGEEVELELADYIWVTPQI